MNINIKTKHIPLISASLQWPITSLKELLPLALITPLTRCMSPLRCANENTYD